MDALDAMNLQAFPDLVRDVASTLGWPEAAARAVVSLQLATTHGHHITESVQDWIIDERVDTSWPRCPAHQTHPLGTMADDSYRTWRCPESGETIARVGELT